MEFLPTPEEAAQAIANDVVISLGGVAVVSAISFLFGMLVRYVMSEVRNRPLWKVSDPAKVVVVTATSASDELDGYTRHSTGSGQVKALSHINRAFYKSFPQCALNRVLMSMEAHGPALDNHVISVGGPNTNSVTRDFLDKSGSVFRIAIKPGNAISISGVGEFAPTLKDGAVQSDIGVVIACPNPYFPDKRALIFFGAHTYGTEAAAEYFARAGGFFSTLRKRYYVLVVEAHVSGQTVGQARKLACRQLSFSAEGGRAGGTPPAAPQTA